MTLDWFAWFDAILKNILEAAQKKTAVCRHFNAAYLMWGLPIISRKPMQIEWGRIIAVQNKRPASRQIKKAIKKAGKPAFFCGCFLFLRTAQNSTQPHVFAII